MKKILTLFLALSLVVMSSCSSKKKPKNRTTTEYGPLESEEFIMNGFTLVSEDGYYVSITFPSPIFIARENKDITQFEFEIVTLQSDETIFKMDKELALRHKADDKAGPLQMDISKEKLKSNYEQDSQLYQISDILLKVKYTTDSQEKSLELLYPSEPSKVEVFARK